jgi:hypothetical protein
MAKKNTSRLFLVKLQKFLKTFEQKLNKKLKPHQRKNTKIELRYAVNHLDGTRIQGARISMEINYSCHSKHPSENHWVYDVKRALQLNAVEVDGQKNPMKAVMEPYPFYRDAILGNVQLNPRRFTLKQLGSDKTISSIAAWLNDGMLNIAAFYE